MRAGRGRVRAERGWPARRGSEAARRRRRAASAAPDVVASGPVNERRRPRAARRTERTRRREEEEDSDFVLFWAFGPVSDGLRCVKNNSRYAPVEHQKPVSTWILTSENQRYYLVISVYSRLAVLSKDQVPILHLA